jgi:glutamine amidotransferase
LASFTPDGSGLNLIREDAPAAFSLLADQLAERSPRALVSIAHIRKATQGQVALENCHPFVRRWQGQTWVFAHNGNLAGAIPHGDSYRPFGDTDSEVAFCWILDRLDAAGVNSRDPEALAGLLHRCARDLAQRGTFNALTRRAPFRTATLVDPPVQVDFSTVTTAKDVVTILSTEPLTTDEHWHAIEPGSSMLWSGGELLCQHNP